MSHIVQIKTEVKDAMAVAAACKRLGLAEPEQGKYQVFSVTREGLSVRLPGWYYPVVCNLETGAVDFDNFDQFF